MFTDIQIARRSALSLSKALLAPTAVIAVGPQYAVLPADELNPEDVIVKPVRSVRLSLGGSPLPLSVRGYIWVSAG